MKKNLKVKKLIFGWYLKNERNFPWRYTKEPYRIMIAEFMLQRTKAEQVVPVYEKFTKKYPDIYSLSCAKNIDMIQVTKNLGLHWRSDHFIKAAKFIIENYSSVFPDKAEELLKIPGIGEYVAGVILAVCFNKTYPIVDTNIARFINRFYGLRLEGEIRRKNEIIEIAEKIFSVKNIGKFLFAIIDFTSLICKPINPRHENCIIKDYCKYFNSDN